MAQLRVVSVGCGHGELNKIYHNAEIARQKKGWEYVDCIIVGGDFQSLRNSHDVACISMPVKFKQMGDFHEYYSGTRTAPVLTIFCGGNHEASNYLYELRYGGWVAPNIYYLGATNVIRLGPLRIAGMSGIFKGYDYRRPIFERVPYNKEDVQTIYHIRELDVRKLMQIRTPVDVGISHDWPNGIEKHGNLQQLFGKKKHLKGDSMHGRLGSEAASEFLDRVRPAYWFSAHLHTRFALTMGHDNTPLKRVKSSLDEPAEWRYEASQPIQKRVDGPSAHLTMDQELMDRVHQCSTETTTGLGAWQSFAVNCAQKERKEAEAYRASFNDPTRPKGPRPEFQSTWAQVETSGESGRNVVKTHYPEVKNENEIDLDISSGSEGSPPAKRAMTSTTASERPTEATTGVAAWQNFATNCAQAERKAAEAYRASFNDPSRPKAPPPEFNTIWKQVQTSGGTERNIVATHYEPAKINTPVIQSATEDKVADGIRSKLPASLAAPVQTHRPNKKRPAPEAITNRVTKFLALDKPAGHDSYIELVEVQPLAGDTQEIQRPLRLQYDKEWLAITRAFADEIELNNKKAIVPPLRSEEEYLTAIKAAEEWVEEHVVKEGKMEIPENFVCVAPVYDPAEDIPGVEGPPEYPNPQTQQFCDLIGIANKFALSDEEREKRMIAGPPPLSRPEYDPERRRGSRGGHGRGKGKAAAQPKP